MIAVDSSVWIGYLRGHDFAPVLWLRDGLSSESVATPDLAICEVLRGARRRSEFDTFKELLLTVPVVLTGGEHLAVDAADRHLWLRQRGITVRSMVDLLIASACILGNHQLLHNDRDFDPFERYFDLKVIHP
jgi:predicted nucleic acid-binding protein